MELPRRTLIIDIISVVAVIVVYLAVALPRYRIGIDWSDEGFLAIGAERVAHGQIPNRDFVSVQPPLSFYTVALAFKLLGTSLVTLRRFGLLLHASLGALVYFISRHFARPSIAAAAALPMSFLGLPVYGFAPFAIWQGVIAALLAMLLFLRAALRGQTRCAAIAGVLTALTFALRQDQAVYISLAILVATLALAVPRSDRTLLRQSLLLWMIAAGGTMILLGAIGWLAGAAPQIWQQLIVFPVTTYAKTSSTPFPHWDAALSLQRNLLTLLCYVVLLLPVATVVWLINRIARGQFNAVAAIGASLCAWAVFAYGEMLTRSDLQHFLPALPVFMLLGAFWLEHAWANYRALTARIATLSLAAIFAAHIACAAPAAVSDPRQAGLELLDLPRGGTRMPRGKWISDFVKGVQGYVPSERSILALPYEPLFYFLCERRNPTRWNYLWPGDQTADDHAELVAEARRDPPAVVFITNENAMSTYAPTIIDYVHGSYKLAGKFGQLSVYFPNDTSAR